VAEESAAVKASLPRRFSAENARHAGVVVAWLLQAAGQGVEGLCRQDDELALWAVRGCARLALEGMVPRWVCCCRHQLNLQRTLTIEVVSMT
jgi:hypothetical protein